MTGWRLAGRVAVTALALSLMMLAVAVGVGQGQTTTAPSQLTQEYPLGKEKLAHGESGAGRSAGASDRNGPDHSSSLLWLLLLVPVAVLVLLVWVVAYARSGPPLAYGYALGNEARRRRHVPAWVIKLLTPLFAYNHHRDAYVVRGIGHRRGPVLKLRSPAEELPAPRPARVRTAAAPLGARSDAMPARLAREPAPAARAARATPKADTPVSPDTPKPKPKPAKAPQEAKDEKTAKGGKNGKNGKGKKTSAAPKGGQGKAPGSAPALTDVLSGQAKSRPPRAPTGRFERDETATRNDKPPSKTRK